MTGEPLACDGHGLEHCRRRPLFFSMEVGSTIREAYPSNFESFFKVSIPVMKVFGCFLFQILGKLYAVLSDKEQRAVYDEQGVVDEECDALSQDRCWEEYWRLLFPKVLEIRSSQLVSGVDGCKVVIYVLYLFL